MKPLGCFAKIHGNRQGPYARLSTISFFFGVVNRKLALNPRVADRSYGDWNRKTPKLAGCYRCEAIVQAYRRFCTLDDFGRPGRRSDKGRVRLAAFKYRTHIFLLFLPDVTFSSLLGIPYFNTFSQRVSPNSRNVHVCRVPVVTME